MVAALMEFNSSSPDLGLLAAMGVIASNAGAPLLAGADLSFVNADEATLADWNVLRRAQSRRGSTAAAPRACCVIPWQGQRSDRRVRIRGNAGEPAKNELPGEAGHGCDAPARTQLQRAWLQDMEPGDEREIGDLPARSPETVSASCSRVRSRS